MFSEPVSFIDDNGELVYKDINIQPLFNAELNSLGYSYENVIDGMLEGDVYSPGTALRAFINGYTAVTSVALGAKLLHKIPNTKIRGAAQAVWDALF